MKHPHPQTTKQQLTHSLSSHRARCKALSFWETVIGIPTPQPSAVLPAKKDVFTVIYPSHYRRQRRLTLFCPLLKTRLPTPVCQHWSRGLLSARCPGTAAGEEPDFPLHIGISPLTEPEDTTLSAFHILPQTVTARCQALEGWHLLQTSESGGKDNCAPSQ